MDLCFRFTSEENAKEQLAQFVDDQGEWVTASHSHALDIIGTIYKPVPTDSNDPEAFVPPIKLDGFHVNLRIWGDAENMVADKLSKSEYVVNPKTPARVWA